MRTIPVFKKSEFADISLAFPEARIPVGFHWKRLPSSSSGQRKRRFWGRDSAFADSGSYRKYALQWDSTDHVWVIPVSLASKGYQIILMGSVPVVNIINTEEWILQMHNQHEYKQWNSESQQRFWINYLPAPPPPLSSTPRLPSPNQR